MIQKLSKEQMKFIFDNHMINDFPKSELKPWKKIEAGLENDTYFAYGMYENNELLAYAFFIKSSKYNTYLLDYLAVLSGKRQSGIGSKFLQELKNMIQKHLPLSIEYNIETENIIHHVIELFKAINEEELALQYAQIEKQQNDFGKKKPTKVIKVGRNDPCPCGSGKKYKKCCGK